MTSKLKTKPEALVPSLADQLRAAQAAAEELIESEAQRIKSTVDAAGLPINWIRANLRARMGGSCNCACALRLLETKK
jgi:hypothetical protein